MIRKIINHLINILGLLLVYWLIWVRFIRERLPKNIPFILTEEKFYVLTYICIIYLFIIFLLIFPRNPNKFSKTLFEYLYMPLTTFDTTLKTNKFALNFSIKSFSRLYQEIRPLNSKLFYSKKSFIVPLHLIFYMIPRCILIILLLLDIFYFKKIENFYSFILLGILPLLNRYLKYSFKNVKEIYIIDLKKRWDAVIIFGKEELLPLQRDDFSENESFENYINREYEMNEKRLTMEEYMDLYINENLNFYEAYPFLNKEYIQKQFFPTFSLEELQNLENDKNYEKKLSEIDSNLKIFDFSQKMSECEMIISYHAIYSSVTNIPYIKWGRIFIFILYFICWFYILCISFHTLNDLSNTLQAIRWVNIYLVNKEEPFSQI